MKVHYLDSKQGSEQWHAARLGIPTASNFKVLVTPTGKVATGEKRETYKAQLLAERLTGQMMSNFVTPAMLRGTEMEPQARAWYELETGREVRQVGFAYREDLKGKCGASPDGICPDRGVEIKAPLPHNIIPMLLDDAPSSEYVAQVQAGMWICCMDRWDLVLYSGTPGIPNRIYEMYRDPVMHAAFDSAIPAFCRELDAAEAKLRAMGGGVQVDGPTSDGLPEFVPMTKGGR